MKFLTRLFCLTVIFGVLFASCSSTTLISSTPSKARLYINGAYVGETPYYQTDTKIVGSILDIKIEKDGYQPLITTISKTEEADIGAIVGGVFFMVPFLWTLGYQPNHEYQLKPLSVESTTVETAAPNQTTTIQPKSKLEKLRELKALLDDKVITSDEFDKEKAKILALPE